jgi:hypothetical protein
MYEQGMTFHTPERGNTPCLFSKMTTCYASFIIPSDSSDHELIEILVATLLLGKSSVTQNDCPF